MDAFEEFDTKSFVGRLLGKGDMKGLAKKLEEAMPEEKQMEFMEQLQKGSMTLRSFRGFLEQVGSMGPLSSVLHSHKLLCILLCDNFTRFAPFKFGDIFCVLQHICFYGSLLNIE